MLLHISLHSAKYRHWQSSSTWSSLLGHVTSHLTTQCQIPSLAEQQHVELSSGPCYFTSHYTVPNTVTGRAAARGALFWAMLLHISLHSAKYRHWQSSSTWSSLLGHVTSHLTTQCQIPSLAEQQHVELSSGPCYFTSHYTVPNTVT